MFLTLEQAEAGSRFALTDVLRHIPWNAQGLIAAITQQHDSGEVLMLAWMNEESLLETLETRRACYWSRTHGRLWRKGESSGHVQHVHDVRLDCDGDALLLLVDQTGVACHTGRRSCFYNAIQGDQVVVTGNPAEVGA
ncbi:phosphoribosyl-AMP cyclohydrolase [Pseudomonas monteilii]|uniref:Phosphoribosyl-AMP cyclohydrolase n=2 Tax=Pseudomonas TaxID=286 RepID=A0A7X3EY33_9PSED|nr:MULTISPECIES: phosphoribosyl-AMP cyclohydrolase [Pseudomonas]AVH38981.1 phosphoribosyl-AMP cyclohydrolase [Pseudomonas monteilii]MBA6139810.1 phosphoribosyl-AMP cyclohydrolase [Pseudomonas monteilii]MBV4514619.1 phosphoribosyl-AMP cyclohydrolase [Pseudomonas kurunegalensis]MBZ3666700.1 phosphoribosyl-AMP cyclohydrolase [Pseudomonas monteilii]MBZ3672066.1 phosphoribosyl-AMP cyclohydrolase [Pseudomonas monteilii]